MLKGFRIYCRVCQEPEVTLGGRGRKSPLVVVPIIQIFILKSSRSMSSLSSSKQGYHIIDLRFFRFMVILSNGRPIYKGPINTNFVN